MRVLIGMPDPSSLGGPATCEPPLVEALRRSGVDVVEEVYVYGDRFDGITLAQRMRRVLRTAKRFRSLVRSERYDLVHLTTAFDVKALLRDVVCVTAIRRRSRVIFLKIHGTDPAFLRTRNPLIRLLRSILLAQVDAIGVLSTEEQAGALALGLDREDVFVVKNAIEPPAPPTDGTAAPEVPRLLFIARMVPTKGLIDVVRACAILQTEGREFSLLCVGDGPARADAEEEVTLRGLTDRVQFVGYVPESETGAFYASSTALVFPTQTEGFSITIFNAVAAGLPVITTRIRGAADHLSEPENCLWVAPRDPEGLANRIGELLDDPGLRASIRRNNLALAPRFRASHVVGEYVDLYRTLDGRARLRG